MADMSYIHEFIVLAEYLSFSKAAEALFITQPTLSRHIASFEKDLGVQLFVRSTTKVALTDQGKIAYNHLSKAQNHLEEMQKEMALLAQKGANTIILAVPTLWLGTYGEPIIKHFRHKRPDADLILKTTGPIDGYEALVEGKADILIAAEGWHEPSRQVSRQVFANEPYIALLTDACPLAVQEKVSFDDLDGYPLVFVVNRYGNELGNKQIFDMLEANGITSYEIEWAQNAQAVPMVLKECGGVGIFPSCMRLSPQDYLVHKPLEDERCVLEINVSFRTANTNALIEDFCEMVNEMNKKGLFT